MSQRLQQSRIYVLRKRHDDRGASSAWGMVNYKPVFDQREDEFSMHVPAEKTIFLEQKSSKCWPYQIIDE